MKTKNARIPFQIPKGKAERRKLYMEALGSSYRAWCDVLDCSKSFSRENTTRSFKEILEEALSLPRAFWTIIHRAEVGSREDHYEFGVSTMQAPDYFIFIEVRPDAAEKLLAKHGLRALQSHESLRG